MTLSQPWRRLAALFCALLFALAVAACEEEGPLEKAGKKADEAMEESAEAVKEAAEDAKEAAE